MSEFDCIIEIILGARYVVANALSRRVAADDTSIDNSRFEWLGELAAECYDD